MDQSLTKRVWFPLGSFSLAAAPLATAALLVACFTSPWSSALGGIALVPIGLAIAARQLPRSAYASAYLAGLLVHLAGMGWLLNCYRYENALGPYTIQWYWIGTWGGALFAGAFALGRFLVRRQRLPMTILLPTLWVTFELIRHEMADIVTGTGFPWLKLGTAIADNQHFVQIADLGGEYLLTFFVAMVNGAIVDAIQMFYVKDRRRRFELLYAMTMATLFFAMAVGYGHWRLGQSTGERGPTVCLLGELDLPPILSHERLSAADDHSSPNDSLDSQDCIADLLLWPELAYHHTIVEVNQSATNTSLQIKKLYSQTHEKQLTRARRASEDQRKLRFLSLARRARVGANKHFAISYLEQTAQNLGTTLVIGCERLHITSEGSQRYNSLACTDPVTGFQGCYDKINLVPGAESSSGEQEAVDGANDEFSRGRTPRTFYLPTKNGTYRFGAAICYDICFGRHFQQTSSSNLHFFVQVGSEGHDASGRVARWMLRYARLRAVESRRALVRNANLGHSALIDGNGSVLTSLAPVPITEPVWLGSVPIDKRWSLYSRWGDWIAYLACAMVIGAIVSRHRPDKI